jgi:hypothetical protein
MRGGLPIYRLKDLYDEEVNAKANNRYVPDYDPSQPSSHVTYLDANNLYGWAMSQALPVDGFRWLEKEEFEHPVTCKIVQRLIHNS